MRVDRHARPALTHVRTVLARQIRAFSAARVLAAPQPSPAFTAAVAAVKTLSAAPASDTLLALYGLYKQVHPQISVFALRFIRVYAQATDGDVSGARPGLFSLAERAKYDAWAKHKGTTPVYLVTCAQA